MGNYLEPGHTFIDGQTVSAPDINEHVSEAVLKATAISSQVLKDPAALSDEVLINDGGTLKKATIQILKTLILGEGGIGSSSLADEARIPVGGVIDFAGAIPPDGWLLCYGQAVSRVTYATLFEKIGVTHGAGDGTTTFSIPDYRGRVGAGKDDMGGNTAARLSDSSLVGHGVVGTTLGDVGGTQSHVLTVGELASHQHAFTDYYSVHQGGGGPIQFGNDASVVTTTLSNATNAMGSNIRHNNVQPTIVINKIIRYQ